MAPTPQEHLLVNEDKFKSHQLDGNRIVISGMSGLYPQSHNIKEFSDILYNKINPVTQEDLRFKYNHPEVVQHTGSIPDIDSFDAQFFKVHFRLAFSMDPMAKKVLEQSYQAIYDAGVNPEQLSGKKVGVYIGSCFSETEKACFYEAATRSGFGIAGCSKTMFANRISYWLNAKGPSMSIDEACCSSTAALEQAYLAMARGECEAAIVGGTYLCLHPQSSVHYGRIIKLCSDGKTKSFDENADGCAKSEAINILFLQKAKDALRIYAEVLNVKTEFISMLNDETGPKYGFYRDFSNSANFMKTFYEDTKVSPQAIEYVEAFGSALPEADKVELRAIEEVFCKNRKDPLLIGSVMSNIGYGEAASGISAITKVLLGYHTGKLAANLHCEHPRQDIKALREGRMRLVTDHQSFDRTYVAVNGMSVTGLNSHVLLHGHYKPKDLNRYKTNIPHLVTISGRHEDAVTNALEILKSNPVDAEQIALLHNIHKTSISGHLGRGFIILKTGEDNYTISLIEKCEYFDDARRPLWFVYSGMGSQWSSMGTQLMHIPLFAAAIERCRKALEPKGLDIVAIITSPEEKFKNILHSFVGIAAIQIGLTDILHELGLKPDGIIGHSVGELGCAYADGCLTAEEMILAAYYRGLVSLETKFIHGSMAAIGLGYEQISPLCPPEIVVACHNGPESSTISGPADIMRTFVAELTEKGVFAKEVPCSNIAYHSHYIADAGPGLLKYLKETIKSPKERSKRWISSSVPQDRWDEPMAKYCSAEYFTNNLLNAVLFEETSRLIPNNAVLVEIAPHGLLQAILKRSMPDTCTNIPLTRRGHADNTLLLLEAIGKLFMEGYNSNLRVLYPKVEMPVSTGTPFLSHFVKWAHNEKWPLPLYRSATRRFAANCDFVIALQDKEYSYLKGHSIRGNILWSFAASIVLAWDTLAMVLGVPRKELSVEFSELQLHTQPVLHNRRQLKLSVAIHRGTGKFEILDGISKVTTGFINVLDTKNRTGNIIKTENEKMYYTTTDIYKLLCDRDYLFSGDFQSIKGADEFLNNGVLIWQNNWVTFIDGMLQLNALRQTHDTTSLPTRIRTLRINVTEMKINIDSSNVDPSNNTVLLPAKVNETLDNTKCGGVTLENIQFKNLPSVCKTKLALKCLEFVPNQSNIDGASLLEVYLQIVAENVNKDVITVISIPSSITEGSIFKKMNEVIKNIYSIKVNYKQITKEKDLINYDFSNADLVLVQNLSTDEKMQQHLQRVLQRDQFVATEEHLVHSKQSKLISSYRVLYVNTLHSDKGQSELRLLRWGSVAASTPITTVSVHNEADSEFLSSVRANLAADHRLLVVSPYPSPPGLKKLISRWRRDAVQNKMHLITVNNDDIDDHEIKMLDIDLAFNAVNHGVWGGEYYMPVQENTRVSKNVTLQIARFGDYDSLKWADVPNQTGPGINVTVHYVGISNYDINKGKGLTYSNKNIENSFGSDFSGVTENGKRVMGIIRSGAASSRVKALPELLWPVPDHWSLEDAATVPLAYAQALYCLGIKTMLLSEMSILIVGGSGAFGQAAISIALGCRCTVFVAVSDARKKDFLLKQFPSLKAEHIGNSRDHTFCDMVMSETNQKGCDVVISSAREHLKDLSVKCVANFGICLDVSQIHNQDDYLFGFYNLQGLRSYSTIDFSSLFATDNIKEIKLLHELLSDGITRGYVRPLSRVTYASQDVTSAFRLLAINQHRGRVLLSMKDVNIQALHRLSCNPVSSHFVFCDGSTFGLQLANRFVTRGVKNLCLHVISDSAYLQHKTRSWRKLGVVVKVFSTELNENTVPAMLSEALRLGPLEGVYITVNNNQDYNLKEKFIAQLDSVLKKISSDLRYFAVLNIGDNFTGKNVCDRRICQNLPATVLALPDVKYESNTYGARVQSIVDATEQALQSSHSVLLAHKTPQAQPSLLQDLIKLAGIPEDVDKNLTLKDMGVQNHKLQSIRNHLQIAYNIALEEEQVSSLTINTISELDKTIIELPYEEVKGLQTFFNFVDSDELLATTEMVFLPTLVYSPSVRDDEYEPGTKKLCIIPGMEGHHERFRVLCERLKLPALVLQPGLDHPHETLEETAARFAETLLKKTGMENTFYLLGYESGVLIALEIAAILEDNGLTGTVFCVGCTPSELKKELEYQLTDFETEEQLQDGVLRHMYTLMAGGETALLEEALRNVDTWAEKLDTCVRILLGRVSHSAQYARTLIECALAQLQQAKSSSVSVRQLRSQLVLLHAAHDPPEYSSLQQHSRQPIIVHELNTSLAHIATDLNCASIINEYLDPTILEAFASRNICDTYLLNPYTFMAIESKE